MGIDRPPMVKSPPGYVSPPLDGIWLRAPYLHNGSVPNMRALLDAAGGAARAYFFRGVRRARPGRPRLRERDLCRARRRGTTPAATRCGPDGICAASDLACRPQAPCVRHDTTQRGNGNGGHVYGTGSARRRQGRARRVPEDAMSLLRVGRRLGALGMAVVIAALVCFVTRAYPEGRGVIARLLDPRGPAAPAARSRSAPPGRSRGGAGHRPTGRCRSRPARSRARTSRCTPRTRSRACASSRARSRPGCCSRSRRRRGPSPHAVTGARSLAALAALLALVRRAGAAGAHGRARRRRDPGRRGLHPARAGRLARASRSRMLVLAYAGFAVERLFRDGWIVIPYPVEGGGRHGRRAPRVARGRLRLAGLALARARLPRAGARRVPVPRPRDRLALDRHSSCRAASRARSGWRSRRRARCCWWWRRSSTGVIARSRSFCPRPSRRASSPWRRAPRRSCFR